MIMLTTIEWICFSILVAYGVLALYKIGRFFVDRYFINRREGKEVKVLDGYSSESLINALTWSEEDDKELRKELELGGYPRRLIKKAFDKNSIGAVNKLIAFTDKRIEENERK